jgi:hypothetical protein
VRYGLNITPLDTFALREVTAMMKGAEPFVHILLFQCPDCRKPISSAIATSERNPEETDARSFVLSCDCGWLGTQMGLLAKRHWVEAWA